MSTLEVNTIANSSSVAVMQLASSGALGLGGANYGTSGQVLTSQGSGSVPIWSSLGPPTIQVFTSSGTYTPTSGKGVFLVYCIGGGGGSSGANASFGGYGGGSGGCAWLAYTTTEMGSSASVTIGGGGTAGVTVNGAIFPGGQGSSSSFNPGGTGVTITGGGGYGGGNNSNSGGTTTNSYVSWIGQQGDNQSGTIAGKGGASVIFGGGKGADGVTGGSNSSGLAGNSGLVVVFEY